MIASGRGPLEIARLLTTRRMLVALLMGFSSGLPAVVIGTSALFEAWLTLRGVSIKSIALFAFVGLPYVFKFVWAPLFDRYRLPFLGRRRGWLFTLQIITGAAIACLGIVGVPAASAGSPGLAVIASISLGVAFFSASQDTMIAAYRRESLYDDREQSLGASLYVWGYRLAMLFAGGIGLILAFHIPFRDVYYVMATCMGVGIIATLIAREPPETGTPPHSLAAAVIEPFVAFFKANHSGITIVRSAMRNRWRHIILGTGNFFRAYWPALVLLAFVLLYKLGDALALSLVTPFFLKTGFTTQEIGVVFKLFGFWATMGGVFLGGILILRIGMIRGLLIFGILQGASSALFAVLTRTGPDPTWLATVISLQQFADGMGTGALVGFMATLTDRRFTATQFALLTALTAVPRVVISSFTGYMADSLGWPLFFIVCALAAIPGLALIPFLHRGKPGEAGTQQTPS